MLSGVERRFLQCISRPGHALPPAGCEPLTPCPASIFAHCYLFSLPSQPFIFEKRGENTFTNSGYDATSVKQTRNQRQTTGLRNEVTLLQRILGHFLNMDYSNNNYMDLSLNSPL